MSRCCTPSAPSNDGSGKCQRQYYLIPSLTRPLFRGSASAAPGIEQSKITITEQNNDQANFQSLKWELEPSSVSFEGGCCRTRLSSKREVGRLESRGVYGAATAARTPVYGRAGAVKWPSIRSSYSFYSQLKPYSSHQGCVNPPRWLYTNTQLKKDQPLSCMRESRERFSKKCLWLEYFCQDITAF